VELNLELVRCQSVLEEVATVLRPQAENKGLHFQVLVPASDIFFRTDYRTLSQILLNLANNAIKFTDEGEVRIELCQQPDNAQSRKVIEINVEDTGIGMRPEEQKRLFQAFEQLDNSNARRHEGTGLGLYLSQKLAVLLGGKIEVESVHGLGSKFKLVIAER
jgi:signal transduction histidine kinase